MRSFRDSIRSKDFVLTAEIPVSPTWAVGDLQATFAALRPYVDAIQVGDNEDAEGHVAPLAVARIALECGLDAIVHISGRDRNRIALQSDILGAAALGVTSLFLKRGNKLPSALRGRVKSVFDTRVTQLMTMAARISEDSEVVAPDGLYLGAHVTIIEPADDWQAEKVIEKLDAGAGFLQMRPSLDIELLQKYVAALVSSRLTHRATVLATVPLLTEAADVRRIRDRFPDAQLPDAVMQRLGEADNRGREGIAVVAEVLRALAALPGVSGANIIYFGDTDAVVTAIRMAGLAAT